MSSDVINEVSELSRGRPYFAGYMGAISEVLTGGAQTKLIGHEADGLEVEVHDGRPQRTFADGALPGTNLLAVAGCRPWAEWDFGGWPRSARPASASRQLRSAASSR